MTTPTVPNPCVSNAAPAPELTEQQLSDAAYLRADGRPWEAVAVLLGLASVSWLAVRRAAEGDPRFAPLLKRAAKGAAKDAEAVALRRLKACAEKDDPKVAVKASEVLVEYAAERQRNATRLKVARLRAAVEREKLAARAGVAEPPAEGVARPERVEPAPAEPAAERTAGADPAPADRAADHVAPRPPCGAAIMRAWNSSTPSPGPGRTSPPGWCYSKCC